MTRNPRRAVWRAWRRLVSRSRRLTRWEFWPPWAFYPPVVAYVAWLMAKHRSPTLFTAANPAVPGGGFVGESKFDILRGLAAASEYVARAALIRASDGIDSKLECARGFMAAHGLSFPVVLKPDQGQRGSGVVIVRSSAALDRALAECRVDTVLQEYIPGREFGVFYYRRPGERCGRILSVTEKRFPTVVGDGRRTLEELILADDRAVCAARLYCTRHRSALGDIPAAGRAVQLVELGAHCRGAMFLDGGWVMTPALAARVDRIARGFRGFYFGRFDVRVHGSLDDFRGGDSFKIVELNGVTSEATHIYHPGTPLLQAYGVLMTQWRLAFEIGAANRAAGHETTPLRTLLRFVREYQRTARYHLGEQAGTRADVGATRAVNTVRYARTRSV